MADMQSAIAAGISQAIAALANDLVKADVGVAKNQAKRLLAELEIGLGRYIERNFERCSKVKTLLHRFEPIDIEAAYVPSKIKFNKTLVSETQFTNFLLKKKRVVISGIAGSGKSMFLKSIFISFYRKPSDGIPIFVEMRNLNNSKTKTLSENSDPSLMEYLVEEITAIASYFSLEQLEYGLKHGRLVLILDGIDEIDHSIRDGICKQILKISYKYPNTAILASSRPHDRFVSWNEFYTGVIQPLDLAQVTELVKKIEYDETLKNRFLTEVRSRLFKTHEEFLSNPLLCTMMLMTFDEHAEIPSKMHIFYDQAFNVLYNKHDATKASFRRRFFSTLSIDDFKRLLMTFALVSFLENKISMTEADARRFAEQAAKYESLSVDPQMFVNDLEESICLLLKDGAYFSYLHRSFQEYFAALFLANRQVDGIGEIIASINNKLDDNNVISLLVGINRDSFEAKFFRQALQELIVVLRPIDPYKEPLKMFKLFYKAISFDDNEDIDGLLIRNESSRRQWYPILRLLRDYYNEGSHLRWPHEKSAASTVGFEPNSDVEANRLSDAILRKLKMTEYLNSIKQLASHAAAQIDLSATKKRL